MSPIELSWTAKDEGTWYKWRNKSFSLLHYQTSKLIWQNFNELWKALMKSKKIFSSTANIPKQIFVRPCVIWWFCRNSIMVPETTLQTFQTQTFEFWLCEHFQYFQNYKSTRLEQKPHVFWSWHVLYFSCDSNVSPSSFSFFMESSWNCALLHVIRIQPLLPKN